MISLETKLLGLLEAGEMGSIGESTPAGEPDPERKDLVPSSLEPVLIALVPSGRDEEDAVASVLSSFLFPFPLMPPPHLLVGMPRARSSSSISCASLCVCAWHKS